MLTLPKVSEVRRHHARQSRVSFGVASKLSVGKSSAEIRVVSATDETKKAVTFNEPTYGESRLLVFCFYVRLFIPVVTLKYLNVINDMLLYSLAKLFRVCINIQKVCVS